MKKNSAIVFVVIFISLLFGACGDEEKPLDTGDIKLFDDPKDSVEEEYNNNVRLWVSKNINNYELAHYCFKDEEQNCKSPHRNSYYPVIIVVKDGELSEVLTTKTRTPVKYPNEQGEMVYLDEKNYLTVKEGFRLAYERIKIRKYASDIVYTFVYNKDYGFPESLHIESYDGSQKITSEDRVYNFKEL